MGISKGKWISDSTGLERSKPFTRNNGPFTKKIGKREDLEPLKLENYGEGLYNEKEEEKDPELEEMERKIKERLEKKKIETKNEKKESNIFIG
jgi:hypothetical protein